MILLTNIENGRKFLLDEKRIIRCIPTGITFQRIYKAVDCITLIEFDFKGHDHRGHAVNATDYYVEETPEQIAALIKAQQIGITDITKILHYTPEELEQLLTNQDKHTRELIIDEIKEYIVSYDIGSAIHPSVLLIMCDNLKQKYKIK